MARAADLGADRVELYTGPYAEAARRAGLGLNAGHDLDLGNLGPFLQAVPGVEEVSIGQALVADALERGMALAVQAYLRVIAESTGADES